MNAQSGFLLSSLINIHCLRKMWQIERSESSFFRLLHNQEIVGKHALPQKDLLSYLTTKTAAFSSPKSESPVAVVVWGLAKGDTEIYGLLRRLPHSALPLPRPLSPRNPERAKTSP